MVMQKIVEIPEGVSVGLEEGNLVVRGPKGELKRKFSGVKLDVQEGKAIFTSGERRKEKSLAGTWSAHLRNMIIGVTQEWEARLKVVYSHFPMKFNVEGNKLIIQNFMGERKARTAKIYDNAGVEVRKDEVVITGIDKEEVGQTAANIELATKVKGYDRRVFQDGCHLIQKCKPIEKSAEGEKNE